MTEKRFELKANFLNGHVCIIDWLESRQKDAICIFNDLGVLPFSSAKEVCKLLNELHDENEEFNEELMEYDSFKRLYEKKTERLEKENEELKNKIDALEDDNETYHKSLEILNLYTKRFIPTKCTNEFKDCKTNRYYWLDHEGNFEGCLELLNLLDCENELLKTENYQLKGRLMAYEEQIKGDD